jgi:hypothetical protein
MIRTVLGIAILLAIVTIGFWLSAIYTGYVSPNNEYWTKLNSNLPGAARSWACDELKKKGAADVPAHCAR